ncbi:MAG: zinc-ribbon domain-containing protein [Bacteroidaceae bacterium]|nr:zinc-ribbon domain-containing protein [Bacteroidaceae bacterium]
MKTENDNVKENKEERTYHCTDCGSEIRRRDVFCSKCGKLLDKYDFEE